MLNAICLLFSYSNETKKANEKLEHYKTFQVKLPFPFVFPVKQRFSFFRFGHFLIFRLQSAVIQCRRLQLPFNSPPEK